MTREQHRLTTSDDRRPYLYSVLKHNAALSISLPLRAFASSLFTLSVWEMAHVCFEVYTTQVSKSSGSYGLSPSLLMHLNAHSL